MSRFLKRVFIWTCVFAMLLSCSPAMAEFSPRFMQLSSGNGLTLTMRVKAETLSPLSKATLETINEWLDGLALTVSAGKNSMAEISLMGESMLRADVQRKDDYSLTTFSPDGGSYLTAAGDPDALTLLCGREYEWPDPSKFPGAYLKLAPSLYEKLASHVTPKKSREGTSIKNASKAMSSEIYTFSGDEMNEFWPRVLDTLLPAMEETLADQPSLYMKAEDLLENIEFSGECKFKRFLDKAGEDMGLQFTGNASLGDDKRKVTLFYGFTPEKGGYLSFSAPAVKGKNNFKITCSVQMTGKKTANTLAIEGTYTRTFDGKTVSGTLSANLKNTLKEEEEKWSGKVTVSRTENKVKSTWTLTPALTFDDDGLSGTVTLLKKEGNKNTVKATFDVKVGPYEETTPPAAASAKDLRQVSRESALAAVQTEMEPLIAALIELIEPLTEKERTNILHDLRTDAWMNGPVTPALSAAVDELTELEEEEAEEEEPDDDWEDDWEDEEGY
ncbi:MAG: hypothetical protein IKH30_18510 [Clostridia bacterium]|nr:hypothetical protein [Clostridia bacterium]